MKLSVNKPSVKHSYISMKISEMSTCNYDQLCWYCCIQGCCNFRAMYFNMVFTCIYGAKSISDVHEFSTLISMVRDRLLTLMFFKIEFALSYTSYWGRRRVNTITKKLDKLFLNATLSFVYLGLIRV